MWAVHRRSLDRRVRPVVPGGVLGEAWRGGPQAELSRMLKDAASRTSARTQACESGACAGARTADVVDASVVVGGVGRRDLVLTNDQDDLGRIAPAIGAALDHHKMRRIGPANHPLRTHSWSPLCGRSKA
jgi:hypothetical protein